MYSYVVYKNNMSKVIYYAKYKFILRRYWEVFIKDQINTGRYGSAGELVLAEIKSKSKEKVGLSA